MSIAMFALAGFLGGGAYTLVRNGSKLGAVVVGALAVLAAVAGVLWL